MKCIASFGQESKTAKLNMYKFIVYNVVKYLMFNAIKYSVNPDPIGSCVVFTFIFPIKCCNFTY